MVDPKVSDAAIELLSGVHAQGLLMRTTRAAHQAFGEAGFRCGKLKNWSPSVFDEWALARAGFLLRDPASEHDLLLHTDLGVCVSPGDVGRNTLRLTVLAPSDDITPTRASGWRAARKLVDVRLLDVQWMASPGARGKWSSVLATCLTDRWKSAADEPEQWDFEAHATALRDAYCAEVCP